MEALKAKISNAANRKETFSVMHIDVSRAYFHVKAQRLVLKRLRVKDRMGTDAGRRACTARGTRPATGNVICKSTSRIGDFD